MLDVLNMYIRPASPRTLPHYRQQLANLTQHRDQHVARFVQTPGYETNGVRILRHILSYIDYNYLRKFSDDYKKYNSYIRHLRRDLGNIFDPVATGRSYQDCFISSTHALTTHEFICPVDDVDHLKILPFNQPWKFWQNLQPVYIWYYNTPELCQDILLNSLRFKYQPPSYSLIFIDPILITFMYAKFLEGKPTGKDLEHSLQRDFIRQHVTKHFYTQTLDIWCMAQLELICNMSTRDDLVESHRNAAQKMDQRYGHIGIRYLEAYEEMLKEFALVKNANTSISSLFSSKLFITGTMFDKLNYANEWLDVSHHRQYWYVRALRDLPLLKLLVGFYRVIPNVVEVQGAIRELKVQSRKILMSNVFNTIKNTAIKTRVTAEFSEFYASLLDFNV